MTLLRVLPQAEPVVPTPAPLLVALPGLGLTEESWRPTVEALDRSYRVLRLPGYGVPADRGEDLSPERLSRLVVDLALPETGRVVLLGHSASCQVAAHVAALAPDRVVALVLVGPTTDPLAATWPRMVRDWLRTARHEQPGQLPALVRQYHRSGPATMRRAMSAARRDRVERVVARLGCPVLVLRGPDDRICSRAWAELLASRAPGCSAAATLPAGAHMVPFTHGPLVASAVTDWLAAANPDSSAVARPF